MKNSKATHNYLIIKYKNKHQLLELFTTRIQR